MKKNTIKIFGIASLCFGILFLLILGIQYQTGISLTQFSPQGSRQMMGYSIKTYPGTLVIIDGGTKQDTEKLVNYIQGNGGKVDYWFITHIHDDHVGALANLLKDTNIVIENLYISANTIEWYEENEPNRAEFSKEFLELIQNNPKIKKHQEVQIGDYLTIDNMKVEILGINNPEITQNAGNNQSMVFKIYIHDKSILFLGDTGVESQEKLIASQKKKLKSNIVQMAHHGQAGVNKEFYEIVDPQICLWPTPKWLWENDSGQGEDSRDMANKANKKMV